MTVTRPRRAVCRQGRDFFCGPDGRPVGFVTPETEIEFTMPDENRLPISVSMIAGNEAHRIRRALESVAGWTSEIVVVLNEEVSDGTDKIAASFGAQSFPRAVERPRRPKKFRRAEDQQRLDFGVGRRRGGFPGTARGNRAVVCRTG